MNYFLYFTISSSLILILIMIVYFSKKKLNTLENKLYTILMILALVGAIFEVSMLATSKIMDIYPLINTFASKGYLLVIEAWVFILCFYTFYVTTNKNKTKEEIKRKFNVLLVIYLICAVITLILPIYYNFPEGYSNYTYTYGPSTKMVFVTGTIFILISMYYIFTTKGALFIKKNIPIYVYIALATFIAIFQQIVPSATLVSYVEIFITILMYFTMENPDVKMIEELNKNKSLIEKSGQNTSNFLFNVTTESKNYIKTINDISNKALEVDTKDFYKQSFKDLLIKTKEIDTKVNNIIDISAIDIKNIKVVDSKYDINKVCEEVILQTKSKIDENINFVTNISQNLPKSLYGDKIRLKQVLLSVLNNAINHTKSGIISFEVNTIIKYDACRIIINIEDTGKGISLEKVNELLSLNETVTEDELKQIDSLNINLKMVKKIIKMLGGSFLITSEEGKGTKVTIILDQKINFENMNLEEKVSDYNEIIGVKRVLIADDDLKELTDIENYCNDLKVENICTMYGKDVLDRVRTGQKFDLIILDDEMNLMNAISVLENLKENKHFKVPVIVMLKPEKLSVANHYLEEGFSDYIDKSKLDVEIKRVINKYLE